MADPVISIVKDRQHVDGRPIRHRNVNSTEVKQTVEQFCSTISRKLRLPWLSPEERQAIEEQRRKEEQRHIQEVEAKRRVEVEKRQRDTETKRQAEEERARKEADAKRQAEEEQERQKAAEAKRQAEEERSREDAEHAELKR